MKITLFVLILSAVSVSFERNQTETLTSGNPLFTGKNLCNVYDIAASPLGLFQKELPKLSVLASYNRLGWRDHSVIDIDENRFVAPIIRAGEPDVAFFELFYDPSIFRFYDPNGFENSVPLHRFGLTVAAKTRTDVIQMAISANGFYGKQSTLENTNQRVIMGLDQLRLDLATRFHDLVALGFYVGGDAHIDTLHDHNEIMEDRWFEGSLPVLGGYVDFGNDESVVKSIASLQYSSSRFLYVSRSGTGPHSEGGNENALREDSLTFSLQTAADIPVDNVSFEPALLFSISNSRSEILEPKGNNDNPLDLGELRDGKYWNELKTSIGFGSKVKMMDVVTASGEYAFTGRKADFGEFYNSTSQNRSSHLLNFVVKTDMHSYIDWLGENRLSPRVGYFFTDGYEHSADVSSYPPFYPQPFSFIGYRSQAWRYDPENRYDSHYKTRGFIIGVDGSVGENFGYDLYLSFIGRSSEGVSRNAVGVGFQTSFNL